MNSPEVVGRGEVGAAAVDLGELLDELGEHRVGRQHEGGDDHFLAAADVGLLQGEVDDPHVEAERVLVDAAAFGDRRGLAVGDQEDLLVRLLLAGEEAAGELQRLAGVGVVRAGLDVGESAERHLLGAVAEEDDVEVVLRILGGDQLGEGERDGLRRA